MGKISGIYKIINVINDKFYIGSSVDIEQRWYIHKWEANRNEHHSSRFQNAWNKYGEENFRFEILEIVEDRDILQEIEQRYLDELKPYDRDIGYNISKVSCGGKVYGEHPRGMLGKKHTEEKKINQSKLAKELLRLGKLGAVWKNGHPRGMLGKKQTDYQKQIASNGKVKIIFADGVEKIFNSLNEASKETNIPRAVLTTIDKTKQPYKVPKNFKVTHSKYEGIQVLREVV